MGKSMYEDSILQWANTSDHQCIIEHPDREAIATNPLCGDRVTIQVQIEGDTIKQLCYQVRGCLLCRASCAHLAYMAAGLDQAKLKDLRDRFDQFLKASDDTMVFASHQIFSPVRSHRSRHRCVLLPYEATLKALSHSEG